MNRYVISRDENGTFKIEIKFSGGGTAVVRGFSTEEEAEKWVYNRWKEPLPKRK